MIRAAFETKLAGLAPGKATADGLFSGYASLFGAVDLARDAVEPGAFAKSLARRGAAGIRMLFQHDPAQPVGHWKVIREDAKGLYVEGQLTGNVARSADLRELLRDKAVDGLSIGFRTIRSRTDAKTGVRRILEADLWEISIVTFPMLPGARVNSIKSAQSTRSLPTTRKFERWLTQDAGLTRSEARTVITKGFAVLLRGRDAAHHDICGLAETIRKAARLLQLQGNSDDFYNTLSRA
jgi:HK97 family phage prohead protease